ncbi:hypothetical protein BJ742DRAFT_813363 [Cladochytrium replicatum]|nr:hypothetical protein BJ742DRAFT_813363 [Cladochytrium replicatum]
MSCVGQTFCCHYVPIHAVTSILLLPGLMRGLWDLDASSRRTKVPKSSRQFQKFRSRPARIVIISQGTSQKSPTLAWLPPSPERTTDRSNFTLLMADSFGHTRNNLQSFVASVIVVSFVILWILSFLKGWHVWFASRQRSELAGDRPTYCSKQAGMSCME